MRRWLKLSKNYEQYEIDYYVASINKANEILREWIRRKYHKDRGIDTVYAGLLITAIFDKIALSKTCLEKDYYAKKQIGKPLIRRRSGKSTD